MRTLIVGLVLVAAAVTVAALARGTTTAPPRAPEPARAPVPAPQPAPAPIVSVAPAPPPPPPAARDAAPETTWLLPDGTRVRALNGATSPAPLRDAWPPNVPWSPIVGTERSPAGVDWYVHADGTRSTTESKWRADLGRYDAVTRVARPGPRAPAAPVAPDR